MSFPEPRAFQTRTLEKLRAGWRAGHRTQLIMAPTGSGKTYMGLYLISEALKKGKKALFICDRKTLIEQASETADRYGLVEHGVIQADHWRRNTADFQICSAQTLAKRGMPNSDLIIVDEAHTQLKAWTDHVPHTKAAVIGLSATPFAKGLGKLFQNVVVAETMHQLTEDGVLVPMRVLTGRAITHVNMDGAATKSNGEWTDEAQTERGLEIIGDVVTEWHKHAAGLKTIVFGATIKHCEAMAAQFNGAGIMAACFTQKTSDKEREQLLNEYRRPDSMLKILVSVQALAKGFDCIAEGSMVLTERGHVEIEKLSIDDKIWDGYEFVSHSGPIFKGERDVITYAGLTATPDHLVKTAEGWKPFLECASKRIPIVKTSERGSPVREHDRCFSIGDGRQENEPIHVPVSLRGVWERIKRGVVHVANSAMEGMRRLLGSVVACCAMQERSGEMHQAEPQGVFGLRGAWDTVQLPFSACGGGMDNREYRAPSAGPFYPTRPDQQRWTLRAGEHPVDFKTRECMQHQKGRMDVESSSVQSRASRDQVRRQNASEPVLCGDVERCDSGTVPSSIRQTKRRVWDVLNCGPRHSFTCEGLLVHNCADVACVCDVRPMRKSLSEVIQMWGRGLRSHPEKERCILLDFSGNRVRFAVDFEDFYFNGIDRLDDGEKLDKTIRKDEPNEARPCPKCGASPFGRRCVACGFERKSAEAQQHQPGELIAFEVGKHKVERRDLWAHCLTLAVRKGKTTTAEGWASHLYKSIAGNWPPRVRLGVADLPLIGDINPAVIAKEHANRIAWSKAQQKERAS